MCLTVCQAIISRVPAGIDISTCLGSQGEVHDGQSAWQLRLGVTACNINCCFASPTLKDVTGATADAAVVFAGQRMRAEVITALAELMLLSKS